MFAKNQLVLSGLLVGLGLGSFSFGEEAKAYREHALRNDGNVERGKALFQDAEKLACALCHSIDGSAGKAGPDLQAAGDAFGRRDLVDAILNPSATIAPGYGTVIVETKDGGSHMGTLKKASDAGLQLMGIDGRLVTIPADSIKERSGSATSLMPEGLHAGLSIQEFTDLIEYLTTLKQPESEVMRNQGMPAELPMLEKPVELRAVFEKPFQLPRVRAETGLSSVRQLPGFPETFFVLHQRGTIWRVKKGAGDERTVFLNLNTEVFSERGPNGLLDVCFHPDFKKNRLYYLFYQIFEDGKVVSLIIEREISEGFMTDSGKPGREIIRFVSVAEDHSGGCLEFGSDGFLYLVMGDTGPHNDPNGHAQNLQMLLGKMLRIDVDHRDPGLEYAIPADNPFVGQSDVRPEIWAYGLRNPWRFCFDRTNGDLWLADVGQDRGEEVDLIKRGENYGWNIYEGFEAFSNQYRIEGRECVEPLFAYRRKYGNSITGGHVFRGDESSSFNGVYICGDYNSKLLFGITKKDDVLDKARQIGKFPQRLVSFCEDEAGNIYAVGYEGMIYQLDFSNAHFD